MGLLSIFKRNTEAPAAKPVADSADAVQQVRTRARRRLIGAAVLVGIGIIGFPLVFETQPRPIPVDLPIEIPRKEGAAPLPMPAAPQAPAVESAKPAVITETREEAAPAPESKPTVVAKGDPQPATPPPAPAMVEKPASKPVAKPPEKVAEKPPEKPQDKPKPAEAARVQALLEGKLADKKASEAAAGRFIVQVGAFGDAGAAREARVKVEKLGLKTYTQVIENADGKRTRVRVGPFATREEADKASGRIRAAGLAAAILTL